MGFDPAEDGGFDAAEAEVEGIAFHFREGEFHGVRVALGGEQVDDGSAGIAEAEEFADLIESLARGVVAGFP